jgi:hypothetical protein
MTPIDQECPLCRFDIGSVRGCFFSTRPSRRGDGVVRVRWGREGAASRHGLKALPSSPCSECSECCAEVLAHHHYGCTHEECPECSQKIVDCLCEPSQYQYQPTDLVAIHHREGYRAEIRRRREELAERGYTAITIPTSQELPGLHHSIGLLQLFGVPEVATIGLPPNATEALIESVVEDLGFFRAPRRNTEYKFRCGTYYFVIEVLESEARRLMPLLSNHYRETQFLVNQFVAAGYSGRYPWDAEVDQQFAKLQPLIGVRSTSTSLIGLSCNGYEQGIPTKSYSL